MNNKKLSEKALEARREYQRQYYRNNRKKILDYQKQWKQDNPDKAQQYINRYWEKKSNSPSED